jgi:hypothetical protein
MLSSLLLVRYPQPKRPVIADKYTPIADATITNAHIGVEHAVIAAVGAVPAAHNNVTTTPYTNLMSASRRESAGLSVEPSNVNGINKQHEKWIRQYMKDDWGIQYPHELDSCDPSHSLPARSDSIPCRKDRLR